MVRSSAQLSSEEMYDEYCAKRLAALREGPAEWFTGTVRIDPLFPAHDPARAAGGAVTFEPGARTMWHTHPLGQALIITFGRGWVQRDGAPVEEIRAEDVVWFEPGEKHWHGASSTTAMQHIATTEALDGKVVDWMENVSDEQYQRGPSAGDVYCSYLS